MFSGMRNKRIWLLIIVAATAIGTAGTASGQSIQGTDTGFGGANSITGMVLTPSGERMSRPIAIRLQSMTKGDRVASTDSSGNFGFRGLPNGDYQLVIEKERDYEPYRQSINIFQMRGTPGQNFMVSIRLKNKAAVAPTPPVVNADLVGVPKAALELFNKAAELTKAGDRPGAIEQLNRAIEVHPRFMLAHNELGVQYLKLGELEKADAALVAALAIQPDHYAAMVNRGLVLYQMKRYADALPLWREVVKAKDQEAVGHYFLGQTLANLGKFVEAEKELLLSLSLGGDQMVEARRLLAIIYNYSGDKQRAADQLETYLKVNPKTADAEQLRKVIEQFRATAKAKPTQ